MRGRVRQSSRLQNKFDFSRFLRLSIFSILGPERAKKSIGVHGFAENRENRQPRFQRGKKPIGADAGGRSVWEMNAGALGASRQDVRDRCGATARQLCGLGCSICQSALAHKVVKVDRTSGALAGFVPDSTSPARRASVRVRAAIQAGPNFHYQ